MPIKTSQIVDTALATAVGFKHLKNQAENNLLSAENNLSTSIVQEAQANKVKVNLLFDLITLSYRSNIESVSI